MNAFDGLELKGIMDKYKLTLSVAESLTSGNIQALIGSISGASTFFEGGITTYTLKQKVRQLGVNREHAREVNSVSERVAIEMAQGVCRRFKSDIGIGTTGYAEPSPEQDVDSPYAYFAIWRQDHKNLNGELLTVQLEVGKNLNRTEMQRFLANKVLITLMEILHGSYPI